MHCGIKFLCCYISFNFSFCRREQFEAISPNFAALVKSETLEAMTLTLKGDGKSVSSEGVPYDILSRFFAPRLGADEDQVTGIQQL